MLARVSLIIVLGFVAYGCVLSSPFKTMDDRLSIVDNPMIRSVQNIPAIFRQGYFHDQFYYRPLVNLSFLGEYQAFGLNPFFYNLDNLILHILNAILVVLLVSRLTNNETIGFWTGLLFVIHPVQWEAVCNIPGRAILLSAFFVLSSFVLFLEFYKHKRPFILPLVLITFFMGLLCKESTGVLPMVLLVYLSLDKTMPWIKKIKFLWPFFIGIAIYVFLRHHLGINKLYSADNPLALSLGFVTFLRSVITDLRLFVLPVDLHYDRCLPFFMSFSTPPAVLAISFWSVVLAFLYSWRRKINPFVFFLIFWFALELLPVSQLVAGIGVGTGYVSTAEHFLYLACIPVFIGMVMAFQWVYEKNLKVGLVQSWVLRFLAGGFLVFLFLTAVEQSIYASNEYTMLSRSLAFEPNNPRIQGAMGLVSVFRNDIPDAEKRFRAAIKAEPANPIYHISLGAALCEQGEWIEGLEQLVAFDPGARKALVERQERLAMTHIRQELAGGKSFDFRGWLAIGIYETENQHFQQALEAFQKTVRLKPDQPDAWFDLGSIYETQKNWSAAMMAYKKLLTLHDISLYQKDFAKEHLAIIVQTLDPR